jgi:hypothetical protein
MDSSKTPVTTAYIEPLTSMQQMRINADFSRRTYTSISSLTACISSEFGHKIASLMQKNLFAVFYTKIAKQKKVLCCPGASQKILPNAQHCRPLSSS